MDCVGACLRLCDENEKRNMYSRIIVIVTLCCRLSWRYQIQTMRGRCVCWRCGVRRGFVRKEEDEEYEDEDGEVSGEARNVLWMARSYYTT